MVTIDLSATPRTAQSHPAALSNRVLELTPEGVHQYGGGYSEYVARTGQGSPGLHPQGLWGRRG